MASDRDASAIQLDKLPQELLVQIMPHLDINSLKSVRLCCKTFQHMPNKELFKNFYLYPHESRFEDLLSLAQTDTIRECVLSLVYELGRANVGELLIKRRQHYDLDTQGPAGLRPPDWTNDALVKADNEMKIQSYLVKAYPRLPALTSVCVIDLLHPFSKEKGEAWSYSTAPDYYKRLMIKEMGLPSEKYYASAQNFQPASVASCILKAASISNLSLVEIDFEGVSTTDIFSNTPTQYIPQIHGPSLGNLEKLCINFGSVPRRRERAALARLPILLSQCPNLLFLSLDFGAIGRDHVDFDSIHPYTNTSIMDDLFPNTPYDERRLIYSPKLRMLDLRGFRCKERDYASILSEIIYLPCPNFMDLFLLDLTVLPQEVYIRRACLVDLIKLLRRMQLYIVRLSGTLTNTGNQKWFVAPSPGENTLFDKVHEYMLWQGDYEKPDAECPLDFVAVQDGEWDVVVPVEDTEENQKWKGDESWQMDNYELEGEGGVWVSAELMQYFDAGDDSPPEQ